MPDEIRALLEGLTGQALPLPAEGAKLASKQLSDNGPGLGYSQFNELLLLCGYDRVTKEFFQFLVSDELEYQPGSAFHTTGDLRRGVERFQMLALWLFGNVKYAFKTLSRDIDELVYWYQRTRPLPVKPYEDRHPPIRPIDPIDGQDTYLLGYIIEAQLRERLKEKPGDGSARAEEERRQSTVSKGMRNHDSYLASDHLDVYVATSMRLPHEYLMVARLTERIFAHRTLEKLNLRWFDPTQAYCADRIDKGLAEALMLKRAKCTVYFAQESDTFGKDSELASTLAQGKPVIAFVPRADSQTVNELMEALSSAYPNRKEEDLLLEQLRVFAPDAAWHDTQLRRWLDSPQSIDLPQLRRRLEVAVIDHYRKRAATLREIHPLGLQVQLSTGVANGVLVVDTIDDCAALLRCILTRTLRFKLEEISRDGKKYILLREYISDCVFRVSTGDQMLTNAFWNFYLEEEE